MAADNAQAVQFVEESILGLRAALNECKFRFFIFYGYETGTIILRALEDMVLEMRGEVLVVNFGNRMDVIRERLLSGVLESVQWRNYLELRYFLERKMRRNTLFPLRTEFARLTDLHPAEGSKKALKLVAITALLGRISEAGTLLYQVCDRYPVPEDVTNWLAANTPEMHRSNLAAFPGLPNGLPAGFPLVPRPPDVPLPPGA